MGAFYPVGLSKGEWLEYYSKFFPTVEINSTYYRVPSPRTIQSWIKKSHESFQFSIKLPSTITHKEILNDPRHAAKLAEKFEETVINPVASKGLLGAALIQLTPYLKYPQGFEALQKLLRELDTSSFNYAVELRNKTWIEGNHLNPKIRAVFEELDVACCMVDGPGFPPIFENTASHAYLRFHGHRKDVWFKGESGMERYDYEYSLDELSPWAERVEELGEETVRIYFNNHPKGKAPKNAMTLMDHLGIAGPRKPVVIQEQKKLEFY